MSKDRPLFNIAHRGARSLAPENTMLAFHRAWQEGAHGVETDVSVSKDGELLLFHDSTLMRTTNIAEIYPKLQKNSIHTISSQQIEQLDAGSWFITTDPFGTIKDGTLSARDVDAIRNIAVPRLEELLCFVKEKSWFVNIEIKTLPRANSNFPVVERVLSVIEKLHLELHLFSISSFHHPYLREVQKLHPDIEVNALIGDNKLMGNNWAEYDFDIYNANSDLIDVDQIKKAHQRGCRVNLYTVNTRDEMKHFYENGVEKIITDYPQWLAKLALNTPKST